MAVRVSIVSVWKKNEKVGKKMGATKSRFCYLAQATQKMGVFVLFCGNWEKRRGEGSANDNGERHTRYGVLFRQKVI
jgi:hypothetical protein